MMNIHSSTKKYGLIYWCIFLVPFLISPLSCQKQENGKREKGKVTRSEILKNLELSLTELIESHPLSDHKARSGILNNDKTILDPLIHGKIIARRDVVKKNKPLLLTVNICPEALGEFIKQFQRVIHSKEHLPENLVNNKLKNNKLFLRTWNAFWKIKKKYSDCEKPSWGIITLTLSEDFTQQKKFRSSNVWWLKRKGTFLGYANPPEKFVRPSNFDGFNQEYTSYLKDKNHIVPKVPYKASFKSSFRSRAYGGNEKVNVFDPICVLLNGSHFKVFPIGYVTEVNNKFEIHIDYYAPGVGEIASELIYKSNNGKVLYRSGFEPIGFYIPGLEVREQELGK